MLKRKKSPAKTKAKPKGVISTAAVLNGKRIRKARKKLEITQKQLSRHVKLSRATIVQIEKGRTVPRYDKMQRLLEVLRIA